MQNIEHKIEYMFDKLLHSYKNETLENKKLIIRDFMVLFELLDDQKFILYYDEECMRLYNENQDIIEDDYIDYYSIFRDIYNNSRHITQKLIEPNYNTENNKLIKNLTKYNIEDTIRLVKDFFRTYNMDLYNHFLYLLKNNCFGRILNDKIYLGTTYNFYYLGEDIILVDNFKTIYTAFILVHEVMHSFVMLNAPNKSIKADILLNINSLQEVPSYYIELVFINYLKEIGIEKNDIDYLEKRRMILFKETLEDFKERVTNPEISNLIINDDNFLTILQRDEAIVYGYALGCTYFSKYLEGKASLEPIELTIDSASNKRYLILDKHGITDEDLTKENLERRLR